MTTFPPKPVPPEPDVCCDEPTTPNPIGPLPPLPKGNL